MDTVLKNRKALGITGAVALLAVVPFAAFAALGLVWSQGFEVDASGWSDSDDAWYGDATRVPSGTDGITSSDGSWHAIFSGDGTSAPFSGFDGYRDTWTGEWVAEIDVYLDPAAIATGEGFDYSVAASGSDGAHQRDFIFHVGTVEDYGPVVGKALLVNGSNNADFFTNPFKLVNDNSGNYYEVTTAGWYTLQHVFRDDAGVLAVDLNLLDDGGAVLWTATRTNPADTIPAEVGGNRYAWFTHIDVTGGIAVDNHELFITLPAPSSTDDCKKGGWEAFGFGNQGECVSSVASSAPQGNGTPGEESVAVCHVTSSETNATVMLEVDGSALETHIAHGDTLYDEEEGCGSEEEEEI